MSGQSELSEGCRRSASHPARLVAGARFASARAVAPLISLLESLAPRAIRPFGNTLEGLVIAFGEEGEAFELCSLPRSANLHAG
jgi:hypothetical protein